jgi:hypothetical protein
MSLQSDEVIKRSVDNVQRIYAVIIALAISQAIQSLLKDSNSSTTETSLTRAYAGLPAFIAFLVTLVPF